MHSSMQLKQTNRRSTVLLSQVLCDIHPQRASTETHLKTIVVHTGKRAGRGGLFETLEGLIITEISNLAKVLESTRYALEVLRALHAIFDLLDPFDVFFRYFYHVRFTGIGAGTRFNLSSNSPQYSSAVTSGRCLRNFMFWAICTINTFGG